MTRRLQLTDIPNLEKDLVRAVTIALEEDIGPGDITAELIPPDQTATATIITREQCIVCGIAWADEVFYQLDKNIHIDWQVEDGDVVEANTQFCTLRGNTRVLLTGERTALNFLQLLSGTATTSHEFAQISKTSNFLILDTRKTIPGLRTAQKYAVRCGGCFNHRVGLYDAFLIKENHIEASGSITSAIQIARKLHPKKPVEIEVEDVTQLIKAIDSGADIIMLDNFSSQQLSEIVDIDTKKAKIELSGNINRDNINDLNALKIHYISIGALTKNIRSIDLSMILEISNSNN